MSQENKSAIITGGSQGFGYEVTKRFVQEGMNVLFCARNEAVLKKAHDSLLPLVRSNQKVLSFVADVSIPHDVDRLVQYAADSFGSIDVVLANAGIYGPKGPIETIDWDEWSNAVDVNLKGTVLFCRAVVPYFKKQRYGKIIVLSGGGATKPMPYLSAYAATKAGVVRFVESLALELAEFNIDVNAIAPGALNTRLLQEVLDAGPEKVGKEFYERSVQQQKSGGAALNIGADLCHYLASPQSNGITGKLISAIWDPWKTFQEHLDDLKNSDIYTLRRIIPKERGMDWGDAE